MSADLMDAISDGDSGTNGQYAGLQNLIAITVAVIAMFMAVCNVKDGNIVQAMEEAQANKIDHWSFYQARNIREEIAKATSAQLRVTLASATTPMVRDAATRALAATDSLAHEQHAKKDSLRTQAETDQRTYDTLNRHDDQFDLTEAMLSLAVSLLALTALTKRRWLYGVALIPTTIGIVMGLAGLCGWGLHWDWFSRLLS